MSKKRHTKKEIQEVFRRLGLASEEKRRELEQLGGQVRERSADIAYRVKLESSSNELTEEGGDA